MQIFEAIKLNESKKTLAIKQTHFDLEDERLLINSTIKDVDNTILVTFL